MEFLKHIHQSYHCRIRCNISVLLFSFWDREVSVEIDSHQQFGPAGALPNSQEDTLNGQGVIRGEVASEDVPLPLSCHQLESDDIGSDLLQRLDRKLRRHVVKHCYSAAVLYWCVRRYNTVSSRFTGVDTIYKLRILENKQFQIGLYHPPQIRLDYSVPTITYIIRSEPYWYIGFSPSLALIPPPRSLPRTPAHSLPTVSFYPPIPTGILSPAIS